MAQKTIVTITDDLDGTEEDKDRGVLIESHTFVLDGQVYEIDLSEVNASKLRAALAEYVDAARNLGKAPKELGGSGRSSVSRISATASKGSTGKSNAPNSPERQRSREARQWLKDNHPELEISNRGRLPQEAIDLLPENLRPTG